ncbi:reverse transcriptase domain-containing protein [Tanacetum coccineum]|uniref:Reverse transcriptase domain-containing protein n=1 Tax=Tanacetum coccineum TaxID=301880 RepID=A0ABQ5CPT2_9ASTR
MYDIRRSHPAYLKGLQDFLIFAENNRVNSGDAGIYCPCIDCKNFVRLKNIKDIEYHLITRGFVQKYTCWSRHGELLVDNSTSVRTSMDNENGDSCINDDCENSNEMSDNVEDTTGDNDQENIQTLLEKSQKPLYASCTKFSVLSGVLRLFGVKAKHRWTDTSFTNLLEAVHEMLPDGNELPLSLYQAKKMMCPTELEVERIHVCPNDCILYRDTYANIHRCPICKESRYMGVLKGYVRNQVRPEGSIVTGYLVEELIEFGNDVVKGVRNIGIPHSRHVGRLTGVGTIGLRMIDPDRDALKVALL